MKAINQAAAIYAKAGFSFEQSLGWYLLHGVVISTPDRFLMAKAVRKEVGESDWNPDNPDCWYVAIAVGKGCLKWFLEQAPFRLPYLAWARMKAKGNPVRIYRAERFARLV